MNAPLIHQIPNLPGIETSTPAVHVQQPSDRVVIYHQERRGDRCWRRQWAGGDRLDLRHRRAGVNNKGGREVQADRAGVDYRLYLIGPNETVSLFFGLHPKREIHSEIHTVSVSHRHDSMFFDNVTCEPGRTEPQFQFSCAGKGEVAEGAEKRRQTSGNIDEGVVGGS